MFEHVYVIKHLGMGLRYRATVPSNYHPYAIYKYWLSKNVKG